MFESPYQALARPLAILDHKLLKEKQHDIKKINQYALLETIGQTAQTKVYLALDVDTNVAYAAKAVSVGGSALEREVRLLRGLHHPNIVELHEVLHAKRQGIFYLILEWASSGSLAQALTAGLPECTVASIFKQIGRGLAFLHDNRIVHHDVKPSNILLFSDGVAKLSDFGVGHSIESADTVIGTPAYQAPEFFDEDADIELDPVKEDVWSMGVSLYEAAFGELPFKGGNVYEIAWNILHTELVIPLSASEELRDLLTKMLEPNPGKRVTLLEVQRHPFFERAEASFTLPGETHAPPKLTPARSMTYTVAKVCDESYSFIKKQLSASSPVSLYGYF
jgi:serine/threonine-protein kinase 11